MRWRHGFYLTRLPWSYLRGAPYLTLSALLASAVSHFLIENLIMADKEATVYIIDMGRSMGEKRYGREVSDQDWAMTYVWEKITSTVSTNG